MGTRRRRAARPPGPPPLVRLVGAALDLELAVAAARAEGERRTGRPVSEADTLGAIDAARADRRLLDPARPRLAAAVAAANRLADLIDKAGAAR